MRGAKVIVLVVLGGTLLGNDDCFEVPTCDAVRTVILVLEIHFRDLVVVSAINGL